MQFKSFNQTIQIRLFLMLVTSISTAAVIPYVIIYFSKQVGTLMTGFLFLVVMIFNVMGSVFGGYVSDRTGRKIIILISELIICAGYVGVALVNSSWGVYPYVAFVFFLFIQFSLGAVNPVYQALIIDMSAEDERKAIYTYSYWIRNTGFAVGSMIGAFLFFEYLFYLFLGVAMTTLLTFFITLFFIKESYVPVYQNSRKNAGGTLNMLKSYKRILAHRMFLIFSMASLIFVSVEEQLTNYIGVSLASEIPDPTPLIPSLPLEVDGVNLLGILKSENTILVVCLTMVLAGLFKKRNDRHVLLIGLFFYFAGYTFISISETPLILILAMFFASMGEMMYIPVSQTMLSKMVPDHARSSYMALYTIATILGVSSAGIFLIISSWVPPVVLTIMIGLMGVVSMSLFSLISHPKKQHRMSVQVERTMHQS